MGKQNTRVEITEERVREIVREEMCRLMVPEELMRSLEVTKTTKEGNNHRMRALRSSPSSMASKLPSSLAMRGVRD